MLKRWTSSALLLGLLLPRPVLGQEVAAKPDDCLSSGPMLGYSEIKETVIWLQTDRPCRVQVRFWPREEPSTARLSEEILTMVAADHIAKIRLGDLRFGTEYAYELYVEGRKVDLPEQAMFRTQALWQWRTDPPDFKAAIGSCVYTNEAPYDRPGEPYGSNYQILETIADQQPDFMLWLGDNLYLREADWLTEAGIRYRYARDRRQSELRRLLASVHNYATWDDHDFGPNNSDRTFRGRQHSLRAFRDYWANPSYGLPETPGVFTRFEWADAEFFLLDNRYYRSPSLSPETEEKKMLGEAQMRWLKEALVSSTATFKLVVGGGQLLNPLRYKAWWIETWARFPQEQQDLSTFLEESQVAGVVFLSGDRHFTELLKIERPGLYPLYEFTSSPLTSRPSTPQKEDHTNPVRVPGTFFPGIHNFGLLEVAGASGDRVLTLRTLDKEGGELWRHEIHQSELALPR